MRLEHHFVGGYVHYISPYIIIIIKYQLVILARRQSTQTKLDTSNKSRQVCERLSANAIPLPPEKEKKHSQGPQTF